MATRHDRREAQRLEWERQAKLERMKNFTCNGTVRIVQYQEPKWTYTKPQREKELEA